MGRKAKEVCECEFCLVLVCVEMLGWCRKGEAVVAVVWGMCGELVSFLTRGFPFQLTRSVCDSL